MKEQLSEGKGALWHSTAESPAAVEQHSADACDSEEVPDVPANSSKRRKLLIVEKRDWV